MALSFIKKPSFFSFLWIALSTAIIFFPLYALAEQSNCLESLSEPKIIFLAHLGKTNEAIQEYYEYKKKAGSDNSYLLQQLALTIIETAWRGGDDEGKMMAIFGAGIALDDSCKKILQEALQSNNPRLQLLALHLLSLHFDDEAEQAIVHALNSEYMLIRCEAALYLAHKHNARATAQIDALFYRLPMELHPLLPNLYMASGDEGAIKGLKRLLTHSLTEVRVEALNALSHAKRDDLLPIIRKLVLQNDRAQQEAACYALGVLNDSSSLPQLEKLLNSKENYVAIAAALACYRLGETNSYKVICEKGRQGDLFALTALAEIPESKEFLAKLIHHPNLQIRINSSLALLKQQDCRSIDGIKEILFSKERGLFLTQWSTPGKTGKAWRLIPSGADEEPSALETKENVLVQAAMLPEDAFLQLAEELLNRELYELTPTIATLLEQHQSPKAQKLLLSHQNHLGAPLIRLWCSLALYKAKGDKNSSKVLREWLNKNQSKELIKFNSFTPYSMKKTSQGERSAYQLTAQEQCRLLIEVLEAFAQAGEEESIDVLLEAINKGHPQNRAVLAGLLLRAMQ